MLLTLLALVGGVVLLAVAADHFVLGAARLALIRRVPPLTVGVVIIGFGTSLPEMLVSVIAASNDQVEVAVGNIAGSSIANLSLLLGVGGCIVPLAVTSATVRREAPLALLAAVAFAVAVQGDGIAVWQGIVLLAAMVATLVVVFRSSKPDPLGPEVVELADVQHSFGFEVARTLVGLTGTVAGAQLLLWGAVDIAERAGLSEGFVGATLVAVGTSLPELVTVVQSARRRETDLIVGNLLGSNIFNCLAVGGAVGLTGGRGLDSVELAVVAPVSAVGVSALAWLAMRTRGGVGRLEGLGLVVLYAAIVPLLA